MPSPPEQEIIIAHVGKNVVVRSIGTDVETSWDDSVLTDHTRMAAITSASRVCIALEHIRGTFDAAVLLLHLKARNLEAGPGNETYLGSVALFGLRLASLATSEGPSGGLTSHIELTHEARKLVATALAAGTRPLLSIRPAHQLPPLIEISIEHIRIYLENVDAASPPT